MRVRLAAALLLLLPACASCLASPIGVLAGPFAGQILAQQRQEATQDTTAVNKPDRVAQSVCHRADEGTHSPHIGAGNSPCGNQTDQVVATENHPEFEVLPQPDRKRAAD